MRETGSLSSPLYPHEDIGKLSPERLQADLNETSVGLREWFYGHDSDSLALHRIRKEDYWRLSATMQGTVKKADRLNGVVQLMVGQKPVEASRFEYRRRGGIARDAVELGPQWTLLLSWDKYFPKSFGDEHLLPAEFYGHSVLHLGSHDAEGAEVGLSLARIAGTLAGGGRLTFVEKPPNTEQP